MKGVGFRACKSLKGVVGVYRDIYLLCLKADGGRNSCATHAESLDCPVHFCTLTKGLGLRN